jgi:hypothetical protein
VKEKINNMTKFKQTRGFKMNGFPAHAGVSPIRKDSDVTVEKTQSLEARIAYPGDAVFEGSETSLRNYPTLESEEFKYTHYPAAADDPTSSTVTRGRKSVQIKTDSDGDITKTTTKKRRDGSIRKTIEYDTVDNQTTKTTTYYDKDGNIKRRKRKDVKTTDKKTSHSEEDQELVDSKNVTYIKGNMRSFYGDR